MFLNVVEFYKFQTKFIIELFFFIFLLSNNTFQLHSPSPYISLLSNFLNYIDICGPSAYYKISTDVSHLVALENKRQVGEILANFHIYQTFGGTAELTEAETFRNKFVIFSFTFHQNQKVFFFF